MIDNSDPVAFALILFVGLLVFSFVSETMSRSCTAVTSVPNYVKKIVFPLQVIPVTVVISALFNLVIGFAILLVAAVALTGHWYASSLLLPVTLAPAILLSLGVGWALASLAVFVRDVSLAVGFLLQILFFLTPIFYPIDAVPDPWRVLLLWNPLATVIQDTRAVLLWGQLPEFGPLLGLIVIGGALALLGYAWFMKTKRTFADVL
jgi:lipopolysaccharide transport system permease protein